MLWTLAKGLGPAWTGEAEAAWTVAYGMIAAEMREGARQAASAALPN